MGHASRSDPEPERARLLGWPSAGERQRGPLDDGDEDLQVGRAKSSAGGADELLPVPVPDISVGRLLCRTR